jgi:SAM-dependent methyltransferase
VTGYGPDLAHVHDTGFGGFARDAAPGLLRMLAEGGIRHGLVADLGCGSGIWARALVDAGYDVLGVDISADMLAIAAERVPEARLVRASAFEAELPACAAVTSIGECLGYAFDRHSGREALADLFARIHAALAPGGMLIFDLAAPGREPPPERPRHDRRAGDGWTLCMEAWEEGERLVRDITVVRDGGPRVHERHDVVLHPPERVLADLEAAGFTARVLDGYGPALRFKRGHRGYAALKPA